MTQLEQRLVIIAKCYYHSVNTFAMTVVLCPKRNETTLPLYISALKVYFNKTTAITMQRKRSITQSSDNPCHSSIAGGRTAVDPFLSHLPIAPKAVSYVRIAQSYVN